MAKAKATHRATYRVEVEFDGSDMDEHDIKLDIRAQLMGLPGEVHVDLDEVEEL